MTTDKVAFISAALSLLTDFAKTRPQFLIEDAVAYAYGKGLEEPYEPRWWGVVASKARADGVISTTGEFRRAVTSNASPKPVWASNIYFS